MWSGIYSSLGLQRPHTLGLHQAYNDPFLLTLVQAKMSGVTDGLIMQCEPFLPVTSTTGQNPPPFSLRLAAIPTAENGGGTFPWFAAAVSATVARLISR